MPHRAISKLPHEQIAPCQPTLPFDAAPIQEGLHQEIPGLIRAELVQAIKACTLSRYQIAARLSELHGRDISKDMLDKYTAESGENYRFPAELVAGFCLVTGTAGLLHAIVQPARHVAIPLPNGKPVQDQDVRQALLRLVKEVGEAAAELEKDLQDRQLSAQEIARLKKEFNDVVQAAVSALHQVETGHPKIF